MTASLPDVAEFPSPDLNNRIMACIYKYELEMEDFFFGSKWEGFPASGGKVIGVTWCVNVSDTFDFATADAEPIDEDSIDLFERVCEWASDRDVEFAAPLLFSVASRGMRPLPHVMKLFFEDSGDEVVDELLSANLKDEVVVLTEEERVAAGRRILDDIGCSYAELKEKMDTRDYNLNERLAWVAMAALGDPDVPLD